jgi:hypothetical protein
VEAERLRLHDPARWATWEQLDAWWARRQDRAWRAARADRRVA